VQKVIVNLFSEGSFWLDTTVILPLLAEVLIEDPSLRHYTTLYKAVRESGIRLFVTDGIIEEIERHINLSLHFSRSELRTWQGDTPFLFAAYALSGRARFEFANWLDNFRGDLQPEEDIRELLEAEFGIVRRNLTEESDSASLELRAAIQEVWHAAHEQRRSRHVNQRDQSTSMRLVAHDVETTAGIIQLRTKSSSSAMGHRYWLVTLDKTAFRLKWELADRLHKVPMSPILSPDFLSQYLRIGPLRTEIESEKRANLPLLVDISKYGYLPKSLVEAADKVRSDLVETSELVVRRKVRDFFNLMRMEEGVETVEGLRGAIKRVQDEIKRSPLTTSVDVLTEEGEAYI
jgi:hypothetical protein